MDDQLSLAGLPHLWRWQLGPRGQQGLQGRPRAVRSRLWWRWFGSAQLAHLSPLEVGQCSAWHLQAVAQPWPLRHEAQQAYLQALDLSLASIGVEHNTALALCRLQLPGWCTLAAANIRTEALLLCGCLAGDI